MQLELGRDYKYWFNILKFLKNNLKYEQLL